MTKFPQNKRPILHPKGLQKKWITYLLCLFLLISCGKGSDLREETIPSQQITFTLTPFNATNTPAPTRQALSTISPTPSPTARPTSIPLTSTPNQSEQGPGKIAVAIQLWNTIDGSSVEVLDEQFRLLYAFPGNYRHLVSFSSDGCQFITINYSDKDGIFIIRELDLQGNELRNTSVSLKEPEDEVRIYQFMLSPTGRWLAYKRVDQMQMSAQGAGIQDVQLLKVEGSGLQEAIQLTERGGAHPADLAWSPDGAYLAYTDYDENGIHQVFLYNPDEGKEIQVTHFNEEMRSHKIIELKWSPDSHALAFLIAGIVETENSYEITDQGAIGILSIPVPTLKWLDFKKYPQYRLYYEWSSYHTIYWNHQGNTLLIPVGLEEGKNKDEALVWYDLESEKVVHLIRPGDISGNSIFSFAFPLNDIDQVGLWYSDAIYIYDRISQAYSKQEKKYFLQENATFLVAPNGPIDPSQCSK